jgi:hypothetical protein
LLKFLFKILVVSNFDATLRFVVRDLFEFVVVDDKPFASPPRPGTNGPILMDDSMTPPPKQPPTPSSASRVTVSTPGTVVQKTLIELDDLIHIRKMELSNLRAQNKIKSEVIMDAFLPFKLDDGCL